ncbi:hypothetical protein [Persicobacter diffluens]
MDKALWEAEDYEAAVKYIRFGLNSLEEDLPNYADPLTAPVIAKLVNTENINAFLEDDALGLQFRQEKGEKYFRQAQALWEKYNVRNSQDKFVYPLELAKITNFLLYAQRVYFANGNQLIKKEAVNPDDATVRKYIQQNESALISNYENMLEFLRHEEAFSQEAFKTLAFSMEQNYQQLKQDIPNGNYTRTIAIIDGLHKKINSKEVLEAIQNIKANLNPKAV